MLGQQELFERHVREVARLRCEREEQVIRAAVVDWLPRRLGWLVDHPRLLWLYVKLPHRRRPEIEQRQDGTVRVVLR